ncbi:MAG: hypothetical protein ACR2JY_18360 [Chloroflexota bacterium]
MRITDVRVISYPLGKLERPYRNSILDDDQQGTDLCGSADG